MPLPLLQVYNWFSHKGKPFLTSSTSVGRSEDDTTQLLSRHESFETSARETYTLADRLRALTAELSSSKKCEPEEIKREEVALQGAVDQFSDNMRSRKAIILQVMDYFKKLNEVLGHGLLGWLVGWLVKGHQLVRCHQLIRGIREISW